MTIPLTSPQTVFITNLTTAFSDFTTALQNALEVDNDVNETFANSDAPRIALSQKYAKLLTFLGAQNVSFLADPGVPVNQTLPGRLQRNTTRSPGPVNPGSSTDYIPRVT